MRDHRVDARDRVVLLDDHDRPIGHADRGSVHGPETPRHLAFSCYLFAADGRVLLTRRALTKRAWPGVWTNSCCGHPRPGEDAASAVRRRVAEELGAGAEDLQLALPDFGYRAVDPSGIVENEACPVWTGRLSGPLRLDPAEVSEVVWAGWADVVALACSLPALLSPWAVLQVPLLDALRDADPGARDSPVGRSA